MGKPTGFMEYQRKTGNTVAPLERIKNFKEFHLQLPKKEQQLQAASFRSGMTLCILETMSRHTAASPRQTVFRNLPPVSARHSAKQPVHAT